MARKRWANLKQIARIFRRLGYKPRHLAKFHLDRRRLKLLSGGEGAGKSLGAALDVAGDFPFWKLVYIVGPSYDQCRKEFQYLAEALLLLNATDASLIHEPKEGRCSLRTYTGAEIVTVSAEDGPKAITGKGESPDIILLVEAGKLSYDIYLTARARVARARGKLIVSGTIEETERWYPELIDRWRGDNTDGGKSFIVPTWANRVTYPGGINDPEIIALRFNFDPDKFKERFGAEPSPPASLIFKAFSFETHVRAEVGYLSQYPVEVWIDPGYSGSFYSVLFVQIVERAVTREHLLDLPDVPVKDVWIIDELYLQHAVHEEVILAAQEKEFWSAVKGGVGDVVMKTHPMAGDAPVDVWSQKANVFLRAQPIKIQEGIDRHRTFLKDPAHGGMPRLFINPGCKGLTGEYTRWKRKKIGEYLYGPPEATNCDALKALNYGLIDHFGHVDPQPKKDKSKEKPPRKLPIMVARRRGIEQ